MIVVSMLSAVVFSCLAVRNKFFLNNEKLKFKSRMKLEISVELSFSSPDEDAGCQLFVGFG